MTHFEYKALNKSGNFLKGVVEAESLKKAKENLKKQGLFLQEIKVKTVENKAQPFFSLQKVKTKELATFTRLLSSLLKAGVPLVEALDSIAQQIPNPYFATIVTHLKNQVNEGKPFHLALKESPLIFDLIYVSLCESGEASGTLDEILEQIAELMEKRASIKGKVLSALFYPGLLFFIAITVMIVLCVYVIPNMMDLFESTEELPFVTKVTLALSNFLINYWLVLIITTVTSAYLFFRWKKTKKGKRTWDAFVLSVPIFSRLIRVSDIAMFAKILSVLLKGGVPVLKSMDIVKNVLSNDLIKEAIEKARNSVKEGESLVDPLSRSGQFPPVVLQMIKVGEKTGNLEELLEQVSQSYDRQIELEISAFTSLLGPVMILFMAGIVIFVLMSALLPMLNSFDALTL